MRSWSHLVGCAVFALALFSCKDNREPKSAEKSKQELLALENRWLHVEDDPVAVEPILASDFLHVVPGAIITKDQHVRFLREHPATRPRPEKHFEDLHVRVYGEAGIVNGAVIEATEHGKRKTLFTDVFAFRDGRWQAVSA
ncbi:MAG: nuclear transport factor 2 family protein, partial [Verrucomicrobia bacterium]|nr:nuclear transport factor 2 family protein [Verrucomicrobiota bacterium]